MALELTGKTITDPLYGNIQLTKLESAIVSTPAFQRLHNVKQLGLGHLVFPSAAYSRFSHSVGASVNADRILTAIQANSSRKFDDKERQCFRIAALFHDLGHYPFSHTTEHAVKRFYRDGLYKAVPIDDRQALLPITELEPVKTTPTYLGHEDVGKLVFLEDGDISAAFTECSIGVTKKDVEEVYLDARLSTIISSDLDCDRMDYLKRTSLHSGAPYGAVDVDFLISKASIDVNGTFCLSHKATRAADHLLMSRFYDFMQIPYHKTVASLEWSLEESVLSLLNSGAIDLSESGVSKMLNDKTWAYFDDGRLLEKMRAAVLQPKLNELDNDHLHAVLHRKPAKCVYFWESLVEAGNNEQPTLEKFLNSAIERISFEKGIDSRRFCVWKAPFKLSKAGPILQRRPSSEAGATDEEEQQLIQMLGRTDSIARPLIDLTNTVSHHLSKLRYQILRVYYLPTKDDPPGLIGEIKLALA